MGEYVLTLLAAAAVTYLLTPAVRRLAVAVGALHAARERDVHVVPTPLLGGFAMYAGLAAGLLVAGRMPALTGAFAEPNMAKGLLLAGALVVIMGFVDDRWGLGAISKLAGQVAAGVILVWSGAAITWLPLPGGGVLGLTTDQQTAATILVVVVTINAVNFIDGLDGLAAGIVGIGAFAFFIYYYTLTHRLGLPDQTGPALVSAILAGICLGFLPHNFHPARIFMGDTGAMLIGLLLAYAPISSLAVLDPASLTSAPAYHAGTVNRFGAILPLLVPAAIMLIPYADLLMAVIRRTRAGTSVFTPDKKHLQHRLLAIGHSHRASVLILYLWAALFAGSVVWLSIVRTSLYILIVVTGAAVLALALLLVSMPRLRPRVRPWVRAAAGFGAAREPAARVAAGVGTAEPRPAFAAAGTELRTAPAPGPSSAPQFEPAPWPGFTAKQEPPANTAPSPEPASEAASWFEPARPSGQPNGPAPAGSPPPHAGQPNGSAEAGPVLSGSAPSRSAPSGSAPSGSAPSGSAPSGSAPSGSAPSGSAPSGSAPSGSAPSDSARSGSDRPTEPGLPDRSGPAEPADGDRWSLPCFPPVDPRLPASLQDRR
jgi:UDP-GlcNAc:undecaprenyl-phosphate GlcNAc-1-phosphate transferase